MRSLFVFALALVAMRAAAQAPAPLEVPYRQFQLANGLNVILHRDATVPIVAVNVWYHVGSANEKVGRTGRHLETAELPVRQVEKPVA